MRTGLFVLLAAAAASVVLGAACSSFGSAADVPPTVDAATDVAVVEGTAACTAPSAPVSAAVACVGSCAVETLFGGQTMDDAVVTGKTIFTMGGKTLGWSRDIDSVAIEKFTPAGVGDGVAKHMAVDDDYVYVSTDTMHVRVSRAKMEVETLPLLGGHPIYIGKSAFFQLQVGLVVRSPKDGSEAGQSSVKVAASDFLG